MATPIGADLTAFQDANRNLPPECLLTLMVFHTENPSSCAIVELDENGVVVGSH